MFFLELILQKMLTKTSSKKTTKSIIGYEELALSFEPIPIEALAFESQFMKRKPKKITPQAFLFGFFQSVLSQNRALRNIAISTGLHLNCTVSKQAVDYRINDGFVEFLERILAALLMQHAGVKAEWAQTSDLFRAFDRVLLHDSTSFSVDPELKDAFPGASNQHGQSATAKIQTVMDILAETFCYFELGAFTENDQSKALDILDIAQPGDLVIRDLGYFAVSALRQMSEKAIFFLSRLRYNVAIFEHGSDNRIDVLKALTQLGALDIDVDLGLKERAAVRLVAQPVSEEILAERIEKTKTDRDKRLHHNEEYMALLAWDIFVTNVPRQIWTTQQVCQANQVRWRIEIVFKTWKSYFKVDVVPKGNETRVRAHIYAALILLTLFQTNIYLTLANLASQNLQTDISVLKLAQFVAEFSLIFFSMAHNPQLQEAIVRQALYHCRYEKRKRQSYPQKFRALF